MCNENRMCIMNGPMNSLVDPKLSPHYNKNPNPNSDPWFLFLSGREESLGTRLPMKTWHYKGKFIQWCEVNFFFLGSFASSNLTYVFTLIRTLFVASATHVSYSLRHDSSLVLFQIWVQHIFPQCVGHLHYIIYRKCNWCEREILLSTYTYMTLSYFLSKLWVTLFTVSSTSTSTSSWIGLLGCWELMYIKVLESEIDLKQ